MKENNRRGYRIFKVSGITEVFKWLSGLTIFIFGAGMVFMGWQLLIKANLPGKLPGD
ncbi:hypothetical protein ACFP1I_11440 [Dyadobacter subterraneus]|uniref:Uncharacterized protein n=1 Tax=Dyadobacter subterraneus TaxID=2773304 RepID=A0ABR9WH90_9BACT|nr:hypothetical protein [Dyadobacter subterraneus]